jgi:hypothetical protein
MSRQQTGAHRCAFLVSCTREWVQLSLLVVLVDDGKRAGVRVSLRINIHVAVAALGVLMCVYVSMCVRMYMPRMYVQVLEGT